LFLKWDKNNLIIEAELSKMILKEIFNKGYTYWIYETEQENLDY